MSEAAMSRERRRASNILGAFALGLTDKISATVRTAGQANDMASAALIQVGFEPGISIERLRNCLGLSHSATVRLIDGLETGGLVQRTRNPAVDSRVAVLMLTRAGKAQMRATLGARAQVTDPILARLSGSEVTTLLAILGKAFPEIVASERESDIVCRLCDLEACPQDRCPACHDAWPSKLERR